MAVLLVGATETTDRVRAAFAEAALAVETCTRDEASGPTRGAIEGAEAVLCVDVDEPRAELSTLLSRLRERLAPTIPIVVLTDRRGANLDALLDAGADDFVGWPQGAGAIASRVHVAKRSRLATARLVHADRMDAVNTLASSIAHTMNNPFAFVLGNLEYVLGVLGDARETLQPHVNVADLEAALNESLEGGRRVVRLIKDLRMLTREEDSARLDLREIIEVVVRLVVPELERRCRLAVTLSDAPHVFGSEARVGHVLLAMILAASALTPERTGKETELNVSCRCEGSDARVEVSVLAALPAGALGGRNAALAPRLDACRELARALHGSFDVDRTAERTTFRLRLPLVA